MVVFREAVWIILKLSLPILLVSIAVGLLLAIFQAATQIHEQTITFAPKLILTGILLLLTGSWMLSNLSEFFTMVMDYMLQL